MAGTWQVNTQGSAYATFELHVPKHTMINAQYFCNLGVNPSTVYSLMATTDPNGIIDNANINSVAVLKDGDYIFLNLSFSYTNNTDNDVYIYVKARSYQSWSQDVKYFINYNTIK